MLLLLLAGAVCLFCGVLLPMLTVKKLLIVKNTFSVLSGIGELLADKTFGLGLLLLFFSVLFPLLKLFVMAAYVLRYPQLADALVKWQRRLARVAKFSMLDVFVVALMLMILKLGWLVEVRIHSGVYWFSAAVIISLLAEFAIGRDIRFRMGHNPDKRSGSV